MAGGDGKERGHGREREGTGSRREGIERIRAQNGKRRDVGMG